MRSIHLAVILGVILASVGTAAYAEPANQAAATPTPTRNCVVPPQGVVVVIDSPGAGAVISPGSNVIVQGVAYDATSSIGPGIDRVSVFLGDRDAGGIFWGDALLNQASPQLGGNLTSAGYSRRSPTVPVGSGARDIFVYAHSSFSGREAVATVPVFLTAAPTNVPGQQPTAVPAPLPACTPTPTPAPTATATATPLPPTATPIPVVLVPTLTPVPPLAPAPLPAAPIPPAAAAPAPAAPAPAAAPAAAQTTAPRGGGIPAELGLIVFGVGASVVGAGLAWRRRERRGPPPRA